MIDKKEHERTILVVDDTPEILLATSRLLKKAGYGVDHVLRGDCRIHQELLNQLVVDCFLNSTIATRHGSAAFHTKGVASGPNFDSVMRFV